MERLNTGAAVGVRLCENQSFSPFKLQQFENPQRGTEKTVLDRVASTSFIAILPEDDRAPLLADVQHLISTHPMTADRSEDSKFHTERIFILVQGST